MTIQMNIAEAKAKLSALIEAAERGEEIIIARNGDPVARIDPLKPKKRKVRLGVLLDYGWNYDIPLEAFEPDPADEETMPLIPDDPST